MKHTFCPRALIIGDPSLLSNTYDTLSQFQATLIRILVELMIALSYPSRSIPLLINAHLYFLDRQHHWLIPNTNPGTTISPPTLSHLVQLWHFPWTMLQTILNLLLKTIQGMLQNLLFLMRKPIGNLMMMMMMVWHFIHKRVPPLLLCFGNFPEISPTPPPRPTTQNLPKTVILILRIVLRNLLDWHHHRLILFANN